MQDITYVPVDIIHQFMVDVFTGLGTPVDDARICAEVLITSDVRGPFKGGPGTRGW